ncbi:MAG: hypothetical protein AAFX40_19450, partial [Cyanobacteria bacterium J06639_1]
NNGRADSNIPWIVCGGSGFSLRRQRPEGNMLHESDELVARSQYFLGRNGRGSHKRRPYSCLEIEVKAGAPPQFVIRPLVIEKYRHRWQPRSVDPWVVGTSAIAPTPELHSPNPAQSEATKSEASPKSSALPTKSNNKAIPNRPAIAVPTNVKTTMTNMPGCLTSVNPKMMPLAIALSRENTPKTLRVRDESI